MTPFESLTITSTLLNHFGSDCHNPDNYIHSYRGQITDYLEDDGKDMGEIFYSLVYFEGALFGGLTLGNLLGSSMHLSVYYPICDRSEQLRKSLLRNKALVSLVCGRLQNARDFPLKETEIERGAIGEEVTCVESPLLDEAAIKQAAETLYDPDAVYPWAMVPPVKFDLIQRLSSEINHE